MKHDNYGRRVVAPDPLIGFKRQSGHLESIVMTGSSVTFDSGMALCSTASGDFDVTTYGGQRITIPWCAYKPLPVTVRTLYAEHTTALGIFAGSGLGLVGGIDEITIDELTLEQFHAMAVIACGDFWRAIGYYPQAIDNQGTIDLVELHATALSFGEL